MAQAARASSRHHDSVLSDPFRFQDFEVPKGSLEEAFLEKACSLRSGSNESNDLFLKRLLPSHNLNATIDELVAKSGRSGQSCGSTSILIVESEFYPNVEELERTREFLSIEEMLAEDKRQEEERLREEEKQRPTEPKPKLLVDKWGFVIEDSDAALPSSVIETKKQREKETNRAEKWVSVISQWNSYSEEKKKKMKQRFRKGIPDRLRGEIWKKICDCDNFHQSNPTLFQDLLGRESAFEEQINKDINRTFPKHIFFREAGGMGQKALYNTLKAYSIYNPMVGYCQGMGFIVALLLLYMPAEDAFIILTRLCSDEKFNMSGLYSPGFPLLHVNLYILEQLLDIYLPRLAAHLKKQMVSTHMFAADWFSTAYTYSLPFPFVLRVFDMYLCEGSRFLFQNALGLLKLMQAELLCSDFEDIVLKLKHITKVSFTPDDLLKAALEFNVSHRRLSKLAAECEEKKAKG